jgi:serine/threonine protein kinase
MNNLKIGTLLQFGKYRIDGVLGKGGFGITYLATDLHMNVTIAIKEFFYEELCVRNSDTGHVTVPSQGKQELVQKFKRKFIKEARIIAGLSHPNIVRVYDAFEENETSYYVMECIYGKSVSELVKEKGKLSPVEALQILNPLCDALAYLHSLKINHLDVKPANVMIENNTGRVVLIDFGVSKLYDMETGNSTTTTPVGLSHGYSPLEQYNVGSVNQFAPQTDIYALGATLYKMVTGKTPPSAIDVSQTGLPQMDPALPITLRNAITAAMNPRRESRPASIAMFRSILDATIIDEPIKPKKNKTWWWVIGITLLLAIGGLVFYIIREQRARFNPEDMIEETVPEEEQEPEEESEPEGLSLDVYSKSISGEVGNSVLSIEYPTDGNPSLVQNIREWINEAFGGKYNGSLNSGQNLLDYYASDIDANEEYVKLTIKKCYETSKAVTFSCSHSYYGKGAAHGLESEIAVTFRKSDGRRFTWDMISDRSALQPLMKRGLKKYFNVLSDEELAANLMMDESLYDVDHLPYPETDPWITNDGVVFNYGEYEIACYAAGCPTFAIPYYSIEDYLVSTAKTFFE